MREQLGSESTVTEIDDFRNECVRETEDDLNRRLLRNHKDFNKRCSKKWRFRCGTLYCHLGKLICNDVSIWYYFTLCHCVNPSTLQKNEGGGEIYEKNTSSLRNHILHGYTKEFTSFLSFLELRNISQPDNASELRTEDGSRKRRKAEKISVGGKWSDYLLPCHPYGGNNLNQRKFDGNVVTLMVHLFTSLLLVDHECFCKLTHYLDTRLCPVGQSKLLRSLIPT